MEYFHLGIFVISRVYLISKNWSQSQAFFFVFHRFFDSVQQEQFEPTVSFFGLNTAVNLLVSMTVWYTLFKILTYTQCTDSDLSIFRSLLMN